MGIIQSVRYRQKKLHQFLSASQCLSYNWRTPSSKFEFKLKKLLPVEEAMKFFRFLKVTTCLLFASDSGKPIITNLYTIASIDFCGFKIRNSKRPGICLSGSLKNIDKNNQVEIQWLFTGKSSKRKFRKYRLILFLFPFGLKCPLAISGFAHIFLKIGLFVLMDSAFQFRMHEFSSYCFLFLLLGAYKIQIAINKMQKTITASDEWFFNKNKNIAIVPFAN